MNDEKSERLATKNDYEQFDKLRKKNMDFMSADISKLAEALSKAQGIMRNAKEDASNPFFKSKYADLTSVWEACRECLSVNGLSVTQMIDNDAERMRLITLLMHSSGQWVKSFMPITPKNMTAQDIGSAMTYARRYALAAIVGVCPADDDGERAMGRHEAFKQPDRDITKETKPHLLSEGQLFEIMDLIGPDDVMRDKILHAMNVESLGHLSPEKADKVIAKLRAKRATEKKEEVKV